MLDKIKVQKSFQILLYVVFITLLYILLRLPNLGDDNFNTDVWKWKSRSYDFGSGVFSGDFEKTIQKYHPGVTLMWIGTIGVKVFNVIGDGFGSGYFDSIQAVFLLDFFQKLLLTAVIGVTISYIFLVIKKYLGITTAGIFVALMIFDPFFTSLTRVFHLEGLLSVLMLAAFLAFYDYQHSKSNLSLVLSGLFTGLSILTKTSGIFVLLFVGLFVLVETRKVTKELIKKILYYFLITILTFVCLWPAMWTHASLALETLYRGVSVIGVERDHIQFYFGKVVEDPGMFFYLVVVLFRTTPYLLLLLVLLYINRKMIFTSLKDDSFHKFKLLKYFGLYFLFYFLQITIPSKKLDRYLLPGYLGLVFMASLSLSYLIEAKSKMLVFIISGYAAFLFMLVGSDGFSYYNPLFGGLQTGMHAIEPKWLIGKDEIVGFFDEIAAKQQFHPGTPGVSFERQIEDGTTDKLLSVGFQEKYYTQVSPFMEQENYYAVIQDLTPHAKETNFFVYPVWDDQGINENRFKIYKIGEIKLRGIPTYNVYQKSE